MSNQNPVQNEYENIKEYHKWIVTRTMWFIGVLTGIGSLLFFLDRANLTNRLDKLDTDYQNAITNIKANAVLEVASVKRQVESEISAEIRNEVTTQLERKNINEIVDRQLDYLLEKTLSYELKIKIEKTIGKTNESLNELVEISDAALFMRLGFKRGLTDLQEYTTNATYSENRARAVELLDKISNDYYNIHSNFSELQLHQLAFVVISNDRKKNEFMEVINDEKSNLNQISAAIILLNKQEGTKFRQFNLEEINKWYEGE